MAKTWCPTCSTQHPVQGKCPGPLNATGPELPGWRVAVEPPEGGVIGYGVLLAEAGRRWRARIMTYPNVLWTVPGGGSTIKFAARTQDAAERKAIDFIREHCHTLGYVMRDELAPVVEEPLPRRVARVPAVVGAERTAVLDRPYRADSSGRAPRFTRHLPVRFGSNRPDTLAAIGNLSATGLFVATSKPMAEGDLVGLLLELETGKLPLRGSVVWQRPNSAPGRPTGMGLQLLNPPGSYVKYIEALAQ